MNRRDFLTKAAAASAAVAIGGNALPAAPATDLVGTLWTRFEVQSLRSFVWPGWSVPPERFRLIDSDGRKYVAVLQSRIHDCGYYNFEPESDNNGPPCLQLADD